MSPYDDSAETFDPTAAGEAPVAVAKAPPAKKAEYKMPAPRLGQPCVWRPDPTEAGELPGFVAKLGRDSVCVMVIVEGSGAPVQIRDGARHISDPRWSRDAGEGGVWDFTDVDKELHEGLEELTNAFEAQGRILQGLTETLKELRGIVAVQGRQIDLLAATSPAPIDKALAPAGDVGEPTEPTEPLGPPAPPAPPKGNRNNR